MSGRVRYDTWRIPTGGDDNRYYDGAASVGNGYVYFLGYNWEGDAGLYRLKRFRERINNNEFHGGDRFCGWPPKRPTSSAAKATTAEEG